MKRLYFGIIWPGILIGLLLPYAGKVASLNGIWNARSVDGQDAFSVIAESSYGSPGAITESVCAELLVEPASPQGVIQLPAFDPAKGQLTGVRITTESTLSADIHRNRLTYPDFQALFTAGLTCSFPGDLRFHQETRLNYQASVNGEQSMLSGVSVQADETKSEVKEVTQSLESFHGPGNLDIPVEVTDLIDCKAENFKYRTHLKAKVCIDYIYEAN